MNYVWDWRENRSGLRHHRIAFQDAIWIFDGTPPEPADVWGNSSIRIGIVDGLEVTLIYSDVSENATAHHFPLESKDVAPAEQRQEFRLDRMHFSLPS